MATESPEGVAGITAVDSMGSSGISHGTLLLPDMPQCEAWTFGSSAELATEAELAESGRSAIP